MRSSILFSFFHCWHVTVKIRISKTQCDRTDLRFSFYVCVRLHTNIKEHLSLILDFVLISSHNPLKQYIIFMTPVTFKAVIHSTKHMETDLKIKLWLHGSFSLKVKEIYVPKKRYIESNYLAGSSELLKQLLITSFQCFLLKVNLSPTDIFRQGLNCLHHPNGFPLFLISLSLLSCKSASNLLLPVCGLCYTRHCL